MINEKELEQEYIERNLGSIMDRIENNNYDYNGEYHDELKSILEYLILTNEDALLRDYCSRVKNIVLDDSCFDKIKKSGCIFVLANNTSTESKNKLEDIIISMKDTYDIYWFALTVQGANIKKLEDAVITDKYGNAICEFAKNVKGANIERLENALIALKDSEYIYYFAKNVKGANISKLEDEMLYFDYESYFYKFANEVKGANISKFENKLIESKDAKKIYTFAKNVKGANIEKLENAIIQTKNAKYISMFAVCIKGANIEKLENAVILTKDNVGIVWFATNVQGANVEKLENIVINSLDAKCIYKFAIDVKNANIAKLTIAILNTKNLEYINSFMQLYKTNLVYIGTKTCYSVLSEGLKQLTKETFLNIKNSKNIARDIFNQGLSEEIRQQFIDYLFNNIDEDNNSVILKFYYEMLKSPNIKEEDVDTLDLEYKIFNEQYKNTSQSNILKLKRFTDKKK